MNKLQNPKVIISIIIFSIISLIILNLSPFGPQVDKSRELYKTAKKYQDQNDYKQAYKIYDKISHGYPAYDLVLLQQAKCAASLEDEKTAIEKLKKVVSKYNNDSVKVLALYNLGQAYVRVGNLDKAEKVFAKIAKKYPQSKYALGGYYYLGQIYKDKDRILAGKYWLAYISMSPDGRFALDCIDGLKSLKISLNFIDKKNIGIALVKGGKWKQAIDFLKQVPIQESWYPLAKANANLGNRTTALYFLKEGITKYSGFVNQEEMKDAMRLYVRYNSKPATQSWSEIIFTARTAKDFALYNKAEKVPQMYAMAFYKSIVDNYPKGNYAVESLWKLFWNDFSRGNYQQAIAMAKKVYNMPATSRSVPKILFWTGKAYERTGNNFEAADYYGKVKTLYPDSYYAFRASGRLQALRFGNDPGWSTNLNKTISEQVQSMPYSYDEIRKEYGVEIAELVAIGDSETALSLIGNDLFLQSWISLRNGVIPRSVVLARDGMQKLMPKPDFRDKRWKLIYPVYFVKEINDSAKLQEVDPVLMLSLIREESHFNPFAISSSNALGLMQLLPGTARDVARWTDLPPVTKFQLFNPKINIAFGTTYFRYTKDKLYGSALYAVAGYNGGPGAVKRWLQTIPHQDIDQFVENIPYDQTRDYVKKVFGSYWNYNRIYGLD